MVFLVNTKAQISYHIKGTIDRKDVDKIFLYEARNRITIDSSIVVAGAFEMKGNRGDESIVMIVTKGPFSGSKIILDNGEYDVKIDSNFKANIVTNSINHNLWANYLKGEAKKANFKAQDSLLSDYTLQIARGNYNLSSQYLAKYHEIQLRLLNYFKKLVYDHPDCYIIPYLLKGGAGILTQENFGSTFKKLSFRVQTNEWGEQIRASLEKRTTVTPDRNQFYLTMLGSKVITVESKLEDETNFDLASLKGKWVLLDFWASWCAPCRTEIPFLVKAYDQFKNKNFVISSVSIDKDKAAWQKALREDNTSQFIQTHIADFGRTEVCKYYQVDAIPANMLINPEGRIVAMDLRGDQLIETLKRVIK